MSKPKRYEEQGRTAFRRGESRESCRYKAADIVRNWQKGWDEASAFAADERRLAAIPRWVEAYVGRTNKCFVLRGDAPQITIERRGDERWRFQATGCGIESQSLGTTDAEDAQREAVVKVREILTARLDHLDKIADLDGRLIAGDQ
jgi:ribosome modulation factor